MSFLLKSNWNFPESPSLPHNVKVIKKVGKTSQLTGPILINHTEFSSQVANEILLPNCNENKERAVCFTRLGHSIS